MLSGLAKFEDIGRYVAMIMYEAIARHLMASVAPAPTVHLTADSYTGGQATQVMSLANLFPRQGAHSCHALGILYTAASGKSARLGDCMTLL
jgi:hypothetical protein